MARDYGLGIEWLLEKLEDYLQVNLGTHLTAINALAVANSLASVDVTAPPNASYYRGLADFRPEDGFPHSSLVYLDAIESRVADRNNVIDEHQVAVLIWLSSAVGDGDTLMRRCSRYERALRRCIRSDYSLGGAKGVWGVWPEQTVWGEYADFNTTLWRSFAVICRARVEEFTT